MVLRQSRVAVTAHAGSLDTVANTPQSFEAALAFPVDCLEADVRFAPDADAYLSHDPLPASLQRNAMRLTELLQLVAAHPAVGLNLDMKEYSRMAEVSDLVKRSGMGGRVLLTGITADVVSKVRERVDGLPYLLNARPSLRERFTRAGAAALARRIRECGALGLNAPHRLVTRRLVRALSEAGLIVSVWTVDGARGMRRMMRLPVHNITTRRVDVLLALRDGRAR